MDSASAEKACQSKKRSRAAFGQTLQSKEGKGNKAGRNNRWRGEEAARLRRCCLHQLNSGLLLKHQQPEGNLWEIPAGVAGAIRIKIATQIERRILLELGLA
ncbi:hypothetical protein OPV22_011441 [Ensete ventricosum]|uniref:Uncharacterized protein n=1 Tax=Ensete ventricosum TaxID=4639 RepID=A0AAV8PYL1_ENSVE|nr:hypothetical protein OPV22_011441 [Ensete ventricosum]